MLVADASNCLQAVCHGGRSQARVPGQQAMELSQPEVELSRQEVEPSELQEMKLNKVVKEDSLRKDTASSPFTHNHHHVSKFIYHNHDIGKLL